MEPTLVLYHANCPDGFASALVANLFLGDVGVEYRPIQYGDRVPDVSNYRNIYILDFSFKKSILEEMAKDGRKVVVLDHHKTGQEELEGLVLSNGGLVKFDMGKCGSVLTWEYFTGAAVPTLLEYVQDRDLWKWKLPFSREISAALDLKERTFEDWSKFQRALTNGSSQIVEQGRAVLKYIERKVDGLASRAEVTSIGGHTIHVVNSSVWQSEIGERLCYLWPGEKFAAVYFVSEGSEIYSLRSRPGEFDVSAIAKLYGGGGGHPGAAGFKRTIS